jgi:hypothetical protein
MGGRNLFALSCYLPLRDACQLPAGMTKRDIIMIVIPAGRWPESLFVFLLSSEMPAPCIQPAGADFASRHDKMTIMTVIPACFWQESLVQIMSFHKSRQAGLFISRSRIFHARFHFLSCFSL